MAETRKLAAILAADVVGYSRLASTDEDMTLARLRALRSDLIDPVIAVHHGRVVKRTGDGALVEFRSVVDAVRCAVELQDGMVVRNAGVSPDRRIEFRIGIHLGDVVEEADGDLMGDGVNIAARLEGFAEPGAICLSEDAYRQVKARLDLGVTDLGHTQLKNIAEPVRIYSLHVGKQVLAQKTPTAAPLPATALRLSIVVLPFANIGGDPEQEYFVDGVTESLTTDLSRIADSFVIARNTAFTYKGKPVDVKEIGRELNVRYVLEGSVQKGGNRLRVNVQLIEVESGAHLWAERFDKPLADLFDMQDEIVARLANQLGTEMITAEARRAEKSPHPDATDLYFQGMACLNSGWTPQLLTQAQDYFERALSLDPGNLEALAGSAYAEILRATNFPSNFAERIAAAEAKAAKVLSRASNHAQAHGLLGVAQMYSRRAAKGIAECERALALDRNLAGVHAWIGIGKVFIGHPEESEAHVIEAFRLSPRDTMAHVWAVIAGSGKLHQGRDEEAVQWLLRAVEANKNVPTAHFILAAALARLNWMDEARAEVAAGLALNPAFTVPHFHQIAVSDNPSVVAAHERVADAMRKAGVPEG